MPGSMTRRSAFTIAVLATVGTLLGVIDGGGNKASGNADGTCTGVVCK